MGTEIVAMLNNEIPIVAGEDTPMDREIKTIEAEKLYHSDLGRMCLQSKAHGITNGKGGNYGNGNAPRTGKAYDPELRKNIREWLETGFTVEETAREFKISEATIYDYIKKWGIPSPCVAAKAAKAESMRSDLMNLTLKEVADKYSISINTAFKYKRMLGLVASHPRALPEPAVAVKVPVKVAGQIAGRVAVASNLDSQIAEMEAKLQALKAEKETAMARVREARQAFMDSVRTLRSLGVRDVEMAEMMASMK